MDEQIEKNKRYKILGYQPQKEIFCNKYLPYADLLDEESERMFNEIKDNLGKALAVHDLDGILFMTQKFAHYIQLYGLKFSKEDHTKFIKIYLELVVIKNLGFLEVNKFCTILTHLLRKINYLSPNDLEIDWKPLNELAKVILYKSESKGVFYRHTWRKTNHSDDGDDDDVQKNSKNSMASMQLDFIRKIAGKFGIDVNSFLENTNMPGELTTYGGGTDEHSMLSTSRLANDYRAPSSIKIGRIAKKDAPIKSVPVVHGSKSKTGGTPSSKTKTKRSYGNSVKVGQPNSGSRSPLDANLTYVIQQCAIYFPRSATIEILDEFYPKLGVLENSKYSQTFEMLSMFLNPINGYDIWLDKMLELWSHYHNAPFTTDLMHLISKAASHNIGVIDWEPHIPSIFARILRSLDLPVTYKGIKSSKKPNYWASTIATWIIATLGPESSTQKYLSELMVVLESYLHPANSGKWVSTIGDVLVQLNKSFVDRLVAERYKPCPWKPAIPDNKKISESCITKFVECMKPIALQAMYSRMNIADVGKIFKILSDLRPELIIDDIVARISTTLESVVEPHKLTASLQCLINVSRAMVSGHNGYTAGKTEIIPILFSVLPGIDPNDFRKTTVTLQFYTSVAFLIPIVDCSKAGNARDDMTEEEHTICCQTADFENFVLLFLEKIFNLIDSSSVENVRMDHSSDADQIRSKMEMISEVWITSTIHAILGQCSDEILDSASDKFINFIQSNQFEPKVAGVLVSALMRIFTRVSGRKTISILLPYVHDKLDTIINDNQHIAKVEKQNDEFLYYLTIFNGIVRGGDPKILIEEKFYGSVLLILDQILYFKCKSTTKLANNILTYFLSNLSSLQTMDCKSMPDAFRLPLTEFLPIRHWGAKIRPKDQIDWYFNRQEAFNLCELIFKRYLFPTMNKLGQFIAGEIKLEKDDIHHHLSLINSVIRCSNFLPNWTIEDEPPIKLADSEFFYYRPKIINGFENRAIKMPDGTNIRLALIKLITTLQNLKIDEDDTRSFKMIVNIYDKIHIHRFNFSNLEIQMKNFRSIKNFQSYDLTKSKRDIRTVVATRVLLQHDLREECNQPHFTASHKLIVDNLVKLSTSGYAEIRQQAQTKLFSILAYYPYAYRCVIDQLVENLKADPNEHHDLFKGTLYMIVGQRKCKLFLKNDWNVIEKLWIGLLHTNLSEKPSIITLLDFITEMMNHELTTITIRVELPKTVETLGLNLISQPNCTPDASQIASGLDKLANTCVTNMATYHRIVNGIIDRVNSNDVHWRFHYIGSSMLYNLDHPQTTYNSITVKYVLNNLTHDLIDERKISIRTLTFILKHNKREHKKRLVDPFEIAGCASQKPDNITMNLPIGLRDDNRFLQYEPKHFPVSQETWDQPIYAFKANGFFGYPSKYYAYAPSAEQPSLDRSPSELNDNIIQFYNFFMDDENIIKLVGFWSLEEKKGKDKFNRSRYVLLKCLFNEFGDVFLDKFLVHVERLIVSNVNKDSNHRCASEILTGIIRGAKHWDYQKTENLYSKLQPIIRLIFTHITVETENFWGTAFATSAERMDPNRQYWLHEVLMEDFFSELWTSYLSCIRIYCFQGPFAQHIWRMNSAGHKVLNYLKPYFSHPLQNVRERISSCLINIFDGDIKFPGGSNPECPRICDLISEMQPKMNILFEKPPKKKSLEDSIPDEKSPAEIERDEKYDEGVRIFKVIAQFTTGFLNRTLNVNRTEFLDLLPLACRLDRSENDAELAEITGSLLALMALAHTHHDTMGYALDKIRQVSEMTWWSARLSILEFLQTIIFHNMPIVMSNVEWMQSVKDIVLRLIEDTVLEVREKAAQVLGGLIHCGFLPASNELLNRFKRKCQTKIVKSPRGVKIATSSNNLLNPDGETREATSIRERHIGVLGLCAFISAYPYDIPEIVPKAFEQLGAHLNDPQPISATIRKTVSNFKRTHQDNWASLQLKLTEDQLAVLTEIDAPPSYYV